MERRTFMALVSGGFLAASLGVEAQQAARVYRIGFVSPISPGPTVDTFRQGLKEVGYVEGKNIIVETRFAEGRSERLPVLVAELIRLKVDVLVVDPVAAGIVASLARPGGNITGVTFEIGGSGFAGKWVELLKEAVPTVSHVAVLSNSASPLTALLVEEVRGAARTLNVKLDVLDPGMPRTSIGRLPRSARAALKRSLCSMTRSLLPIAPSSLHLQQASVCPRYTSSSSSPMPGA